MTHTVPRQMVNEAADWNSFWCKADEVLNSGWAPALGVSAVHAFWEPPSLLRCSASATTIPPQWEETSLPQRFALVVLTEVRAADAPLLPAFTMLGSPRLWKELQAADRAGVTRGMPGYAWRWTWCRGQGVDATTAFARRALADLVALVSPSSSLRPLRGLVLKENAFSGFANLPCGHIRQLLGVSGASRGVFVPPCHGSSEQFPLPVGFYLSSNRVTQATVS